MTSALNKNPQYHIEYSLIAVCMAILYILALFLGFLIIKTERVKRYSLILAVCFGIAALLEYTQEPKIMVGLRKKLHKIYGKTWLGTFLKIILILALYVGFYYVVLIHFVPQELLENILNFFKWFGNAILSIPNQFYW